MGPAAETIVAPITAPGFAGVSVIRLSGPKARSLLADVCERADQVLARPRSLVLSPILDFERGSVLDRGLVVFFEASSSFTGEESVEFHLHGSPYLVGRLIALLLARGARMSEPGEFTRRAFENGQIDLTQAEAICDLIHAETEAQARVAQEQLGGRLRDAVSSVGEPLRDLLAEVEATIDFPEEDLPPSVGSRWRETLDSAAARIQEFLGTFQAGKLAREGAKVVLAGLPNAGKSSLLNRLLGEDRAIVTPVPGTTRDTIEESISIDGIRVRLIDTAGLAEGESAGRVLDEVEKLGVARSWKRVEEADAVLFVFDAAAGFEASRRLAERISAAGRPMLLVGNKIDLEKKSPPLPSSFSKIPLSLVSAKTGAGLDELRRELSSFFAAARTQIGQVVVANARHAAALEEAARELKEASGVTGPGASPEFLALHLRTALSAMNEIVGVTTTDDVLGRIFSKFCIGK